MNKKMTTVILAMLLMLGSCFASEITRGLSSASVAPGGDLVVTLTVNVTGGETFYAIDELVPQGWTVKDAGSGSAEHAGHVKWVVIENAQNTTYQYTLTAPQNESTAQLNGIYQFEGMTAEATIGGTTSVQVKEPTGTQPPANPPQQPVDYTIPIIGLIIAAIAISAFVLYNKK